MRLDSVRTPCVQKSPRFIQVFPLALAVLAVVWPVASSVALSDGGPPGIINDPPVITDFFISSLPGNLWTFEGTVSDENPGTVIIVFGGLLQGTTVPVTEDGTFSYTTQFPAGTSGGVTAVAIDDIGQESETAEDLVE